MSAPSTPPMQREGSSSTVQPQRAPSSILATPSGASRGGADAAQAGSSSSNGGANVHYGRDALFASPSKGSAAASRSRHESTGSNADGGLAAPPRAAYPGLGDKAGRASNLSLGGSTSYASSAAGESAQARSLRNSTARRSRVQTRPAWARDEPVSPPATPHSRPSHAIERQPSDLGLPQASGTQGESWTRSQAPDTHGPSRSTANSDDDSDANGDERGPTRFWTFTLPAKYRARLHEHHMRMVHTSQSQPQRDGDAGDDGSSDTSSTLDQGEHDPAARQRARGRGTEAGKANAAEHQGGGLMGWRRLSQRPKRDSADVEAAAGAGDDDAPGASPDARRSEGPQTPRMRGPPREQSSRSQQQQAARSSHDSSASRDSSSLPAAHMHAEMPAPHHIASFTRHQPHTPGWESPWRPESRDGGSIEVGGYRFGAHGGFFPASKEEGKGGRKKEPPFSWWRNFLLHNPFVPLLFRLVNVAFTTATMAVAIRLHNVLTREAAADSVGSSPLVAIIYAPPTLMHVGFQIYLEYFGKPIGLWSVKSKLYYTLVDLIFICMWSSELSLTFDNYLTSSLVCDAAINPFASNINAPDYESPLRDPGTKPNICRLQGALIGLVFVSLLAYLIVLTVSLFRIFVRVSRHA